MSLSQLSIKTRIETAGFVNLRFHADPGLSQLSIKTRIETLRNFGKLDLTIVWVSYPLKQGLKPAKINRNKIFKIVWVSYPLKQGLKLAIFSTRADRFPVWVSYPLKQGLKPINNPALLPLDKSLSQLSIKTRIETYGYKPWWCWKIGFESAIH